MCLLVLRQFRLSRNAKNDGAPRQVESPSSAAGNRGVTLTSINGNPLFILRSSQKLSFFESFARPTRSIHNTAHSDEFSPLWAQCRDFEEYVGKMRATKTAYAFAKSPTSRNVKIDRSLSTAAITQLFRTKLDIHRVKLRVGDAVICRLQQHREQQNDKRCRLY